MDGTTILFLLVIGALIIFALKNSFQHSLERDGKVGECNPAKLRIDAKVIDIKVYTVGSKTNKSFRVVVLFDDGFNYAKVVNPTNKDNHFAYTTYTLSVEDKTSIINEAVAQHTRALGKQTSNVNTAKVSTGNALTDFSNDIFPNGESSKKYQKKQMKILMGDVPNTDDYLKTFVYCEAHYLVNRKKYPYVVEMLPIAHPEIKDTKTAKRVAAYTYMFAGTKSENMDLTKKEDLDLLDSIVVEFDNQTKNIEANASKNEKPFDENRGLTAENPIYFNGVKAAEDYLKALTDLDGNKLHLGPRLVLNVEGINGLVDGYSMMKEDNNKYGTIYVSIYGSSNYQYVPNGYKHPILKNPKVVDENNETNVFAKNEIEEENTYTASSAIEELDNMLNETGETKQQDISNSRIETDLIKDNNQNKNEETINAYNPNTKENINDNKAWYKTVVFCRKCGTKLSEDALFCRKCGAKVAR